MHGLGNDFMVIDGINQKVHITPERIIAWARRDTGVGFDQCLVIEPSVKAGIDFFYRIFNANGKEVGQCGNGARCLARFIQHHGLSDCTTLHVETFSTHLTLYLNMKNDHVSVDLGLPNFPDEHIHNLSLTPSMNIYPVDVGNPHAILLVEDVQQAPVNTMGKIISEHSFFPEQTNVEFMQINAPDQIQLRVYERGCGETNACGSGAVAAVAVGQKYHGLNDHVTVMLPGGELVVQRTPENHMLLTGPATFVYEGVITSNAYATTSIEQDS